MNRESADETWRPNNFFKVSRFGLKISYVIIANQAATQVGEEGFRGYFRGWKPGARVA